jgi:2,4-diaminopentanoate dehydrogenase
MNDTETLKVGVIGYGQLGKNLVKKLLVDSRFELLGVLDTNPDKQGQFINGIQIQSDLQEFLLKSPLDLVFITTSSSLEKIFDLLVVLLERGLNLISSCEELVFPWVSQPELAERIDSLAKAVQVRVLGTGINPGFLMDYLLTVLAKVFLEIRKIEYTRNINTEFRRINFKEKVGQGLTLKEFENKFQEGLIGHVGLKQSTEMISLALNWELKNYHEKIEPLVEQLESNLDESLVQGISQTAFSEFINDKSISLKFIAGLNQLDRDLIKIETEDGRETEFEIKNGINGETGTVSVLINSAEKLMRLSPGLKTMLDL